MWHEEFAVTTRPAVINDAEAIAKMVGHADSSVVAAAFEELDRMKRPVPRPRVLDLLASSNANIRLLALNRLDAKPDAAAVSA